MRNQLEKLLNYLIEKLNKILPDKVMKYVSRFLSAEFILFVVIGVINTFNTAIIATVLDWVRNRLFDETSLIYESIVNYNITFIIGYVISMVISFLLNTYITFNEKPTWGKFIKFPVSYIPNFIIQYVCVWIFTSLAWNSTIAYLVAAIIAIPITFITMKVFVYKSK